jgi:hypothetical protein
MMESRWDSFAAAERGIFTLVSVGCFSTGEREYAAQTCRFSA